MESLKVESRRQKKQKKQQQKKNGRLAGAADMRWALAFLVFAAVVVAVLCEWGGQACKAGAQRAMEEAPSQPTPAELSVYIQRALLLRVGTVVSCLIALVLLLIFIFKDFRKEADA